MSPHAALAVTSPGASTAGGRITERLGSPPLDDLQGPSQLTQRLAKCEKFDEDCPQRICVDLARAPSVHLEKRCFQGVPSSTERAKPSIAQVGGDKIRVGSKAVAHLVVL